MDFSNLLDFSDIDVLIIIVNNLVAVVFALFVMFTYSATHRGKTFTSSFSVSIGSIVIITTLLMSMISNNIALSLGLVGALSIIRFRTAVKDVQDMIFIFWSVAIGVSCGISQYIYPAITSIVLFIFLLMFSKKITSGKYLYVIRCDSDSMSSVEKSFRAIFKDSCKLKMKNINEAGCEFVFEVSMSKVNKIGEQVISERLVKIDGIENINIVEKTEGVVH